MPSIKQQPPTVAEVVDEYDLRPTRSGMIRCPLHQDDTPSLKLNEDDNWWYCFSCNQTGDGVGLIAALDNIPVEDVLRRYAAANKRWKPVRGLRPHEMRASLLGEYREIHRTFFDELHWRLTDAPDWILLGLVERWSLLFDEVREAIANEDVSLYLREQEVRMLDRKVKEWMSSTA